MDMADDKNKRRGLGRGLSALMADVSAQPDGAAPEQPRRPELFVPIERIVPNPNQPRRRFSEDDLNDLAASISEKGVIQPLIVRKQSDGNYEIVAGERRWRAAQLAKLHELPVLVRDFDDVEVLEVAIIENIQRADLNAIEEAAAFRQLMDKFGHTQEKLAEALGKSRSHIANLMRLLQLPEDVLDLVRGGALSAGHARALIMAAEPSKLAKQIVKGQLSVRQTEVLVKKANTKGSEGSEAKAPKLSRSTEKDADTKALEGDLSAALGMSVAVNHKADSETGDVVISYRSLDDLDEICRILSAR
jgi:ParB family chromosome partitioning protein